MATPNSVFTELVSTTFRKHSKDIKDNLSKRNAFLSYINKRGNTRKEDGGLTIVSTLDFAENSTYQRFSDWDVLNIAQSEVFTSAEFQWRQVALHVSSSGRELRINSGDSRIVNLAKGKIKNAIRTFNNKFSADLYSDGTAPNQVNGIQALISDAGTGTVGGINSTNFTFWKNKVQSAAAPLQGGGAVTVSSSTIENQIMLPLWLELDRGPDDQPDLIVMDNIYWQHFEGSQVSYKTYANKSTADAGMVSIKYKGADCVFDGNSGIPASHMYMVNTNYLELVVHEDADMTVMDEKTSVNQDGVTVPILWMGNLSISNRAQQGVAKA